MSITELTGPEVRSTVDAAIQQSLGIAMLRYGLRFVAVQTVSISHQRYNENRRTAETAWLLKDGLQQQKALDEYYGEDKFREIKSEERINELEILHKQVTNDRDEGKVAALVRRVGIRKRRLEAVQSDEFNEIKDADEFLRMLQEFNKGDLIRKEEFKDLETAYKEEGGRPRSGP